MLSFRFLVKGKVQGVYYRKTVCENAKRAKFSGYVKNLSNGDVEAVVTCGANRVEEFVKILQKGSSFSEVRSIKKESFSKIFKNGFRVEY